MRTHARPRRARLHAMSHVPPQTFSAGDPRSSGRVDAGTDVTPALDRCGSGSRKDPAFTSRVLHGPARAKIAAPTAGEAQQAGSGAGSDAGAGAGALSSSTGAAIRTLVLPFSSPRRVLVTKRGAHAALAWLPLTVLLDLGLRFVCDRTEDRDADAEPSGASGDAGPGAGSDGGAAAVVLPERRVTSFVILGRDAGTHTFRVAAVLPCEEAAAAVMRVATALAEAAGGRAPRFTALRSTLATSLCTPGPDSAALSQASSVLTWQAATQFCGRCGAPTVLIEGGVKMRCRGGGDGDGDGCGQRMYPRSNPAVIAVVVHPDGDRVLLQRGRSFPPGIYTCVAGFLDSGETLAEGVRREVMEETQVGVGKVTVLESQPWPLARGAYAEIMIGCRAQATTRTVTVNKSELDDADWFTRDEVVQALRNSAALDAWGRAAATAGRNGSAAGGGASSGGSKLLMVPPPYAIAHWLIKSWACPDGLAGTPDDVNGAVRAAAAASAARASTSAAGRDGGASTRGTTAGAAAARGKGEGGVASGTPASKM